jgi:hypothetical protein
MHAPRSSLSRLVLLAAVGAAAAIPSSASAQPGTRSALTAVAGQGSGLVKLAPTAHDVVGPGTFDAQGTINVHGAAPGTSFTVQRRVDFTADGVCTGTIWLDLPGSPPPPLVTSRGGAGALHFEIVRGAPLTDGTRFDVLWRLTGSDGSVLESNCFTATVK